MYEGNGDANLKTVNRQATFADDDSTDCGAPWAVGKLGPSELDSLVGAGSCPGGLWPGESTTSPPSLLVASVGEGIQTGTLELPSVDAQDFKGTGDLQIDDLDGDGDTDFLLTNAKASIVVLKDGETTQNAAVDQQGRGCLLYTSPSPRDATLSRMPSSA